MNIMYRLRLPVFALLLAIISCGAETEPTNSDQSSDSTATVSNPDYPLEQLNLPDGFNISIFAEVETPDHWP